MKTSVLIPTAYRPDALNICLSGLIPHSKHIESVVIGFDETEQEFTSNYAFETLTKALEICGVKVVVAYACGDFIRKQIFLSNLTDSTICLVLDDDCVLGDSYFDITRHFARPKVAMVSGSIQSPINPGYTDWSDQKMKAPPPGFVVNRVSYNDGIVQWCDKYQCYMLDSHQWYKANYLVGGAFFLRRALFNEYDLELVHYDKNNKAVTNGSEVDLSMTLKGKGWDLIYDSSAICHHLYWSTGGDRQWDRSLALRNWDYIFKKHGYGRVIKSPKVIKQYEE